MMGFGRLGTLAGIMQVCPLLAIKSKTSFLGF
jgi:hypothetical protein